MKEIKLTRGKVALVDDEDFEELSCWKWCWCPNRKGYAVRRLRLSEGKGHGTISMARHLMNAPNGIMVDHANGDTLDNQRQNLRFATHHQNQINQLRRKDNTSGFKGVAWDKRLGKWRVMLSVDKKVTYLGMFATKTAAAMAYDLWAYDMWGEFAHTNFIISGHSKKKAQAIAA